MRSFAAGLITVLGAFVLGQGAPAQQARSSPIAPTIASVMGQQLRIVEQQFLSAAEAMPADKYSFAPTGGNFEGVRTFAQEVKHTAAINYVFYSALLEQDPPPGVIANKQLNGPDSLQAKTEIIQYLRDSFAFAQRAVSTITAENATTLLSPSGARVGVPSFLNTRLALASFGCTHVFDHYGQIVEYLRMNGVTPPASLGQPPANPK